MVSSRQDWRAEGSANNLLGVERFRAAIQIRLTELKKIELDPLSNPDWCGSLS
jgi:hypothetical protein